MHRQETSLVARPESEAACAVCAEPAPPTQLASGLTCCPACHAVTPSDRFDRPRNSVAAPLRGGAVLRDRYRLVKPLGAGAHGVTYLAHHVFLNHPCVIKLLHASAASEWSSSRLRSEASAGFLVSHECVVRVIDCDVHEDTWYFAMEYVRGADLASLMEAHQPMAWRQVAHLAREAALGLEAIHKVGLIHSDLKPSNLLLGADGRLRIADLGVARLASRTASEQSSSGTLTYAAPELLTGNPATRPSDLYALGSVLYELLTGRPPHSASIYRRYMGDSPLQWPDRDDGPPEWLRATVERLLAPQPAARFQSAAELAAALSTAGRAGQSDDVDADPPSQRGDDAPRGVLVLPFEPVDKAADEGWVGQQLADLLARSLADQHRAYVPDVNQFMATLQRIQAHSSGAHAGRLRQAARLSGAAWIVSGTYQRAGSDYAVTGTLYGPHHADEKHFGPITGGIYDVNTSLLSTVVSAAALEPRPRLWAAAPRERSAEAQRRFFDAKRSFLRGDYGAALASALDAVREEPDFGEAVGYAGVCCARMGRYDEAAAYNRRQQELADLGGDERLRVEAFANLGSMYYFQGDYSRAHQALSRAADVARRLELSPELALIRNNLGFVLLQLGRAEDAEEAYLQAIETHKAHHALVSLIGPYSGLGHVLREQQRYAEARRYFRRVLALAQESDDQVNLGVAYMNLGHCSLLQDRLSDAKHELAIALGTLEPTSFWNGLARVYDYMYQLNLRLGDRTEAIRCARQRYDLARRHDNQVIAEEAKRQCAEAGGQLADNNGTVSRPATERS